MEKTKTRWVFSPQPSLVWTVSFVTRLKPEAQTGLERLRRPGCAARLARDVRATSPIDDHHSHARAMARAEGQSYPGGREGGGGGGHVTANFPTKLVQKKKREKDFGRTFLKLCWAMTG